MKTELNIVLVGDKGAGKTSLATCILTGEGVDEKKKLEDVIDAPIFLSPENTPGHILTKIHDTPSDMSTWSDECVETVRTADAICIIFDDSISQPLARVVSEWLPKLNKLNQSPIILVSNKTDRRQPFTERSPSIEQEMAPIMLQYPQIETGIDCSAKTTTNVSEMVFYAMRSSLLPVGPLYDMHLARLKPRCIRVLGRIFRICDSDFDGVMNDDEIRAFQDFTFGEPLTVNDVTELKKLIAEHCPGGVVKMENGTSGISRSGFEFLQTLFVQKGNLEIIWTIVRKFGYEDDLSDPEFVKNIPELPDTSTVELSPHGIDFLTHIFAVCDVDGDEALNSAEWNLLFSTCDNLPWNLADLRKCVETNEMGNVSVSGFLSFWQLWLALEPVLARQHLFYLGCENVDGSVKVVKDGSSVKKRDQKSKDVHHVYLFGEPEGGKTSLMKALAARNNDETEAYEDELSEVMCFSHNDKYLVLRNFHDSNVLLDQDVMRKCDVLGVVFDGAKKHSFSNVMDVLDNVILHKNNDFLVPLNLPVVCISSKSDLPAESQLCEIEDDGVGDGNDEAEKSTTFITPEAFLHARGLPNPIMVSSKSHEMNDLPQLLSGVAAMPHISVPHPRDHQSHVSWLKVAGGIVGLVGIGVGGYLLYKKLKRS